MWQELSLQTRINVLLALVLTLGLAINIARLAVEAGPRVQAEDQSVIRLARAFVDTIATGLNEASDPDAQLNRIEADLSRLRHVSVFRRSAAPSPDADRAEGEGRAPLWFVSLVHPEQMSARVPLTIAGRPDALVITAHPDDEIEEIWDGITTQLVIGSAIAALLFLFTTRVIRGALAPLQQLSQAMSAIEHGAYDARVAPDGAPELAA